MKRRQNVEFNIMNDKPLPKPTVKTTGGSRWNPADVGGVLCNPVVTGLGPFPQVVPDNTWLKAAEKLVAEQGAEQYLVNMLFMLKESFRQVRGHPARDISIDADNVVATGVGPFPSLISDEQWVRAAAEKLRAQGASTFMRGVLQKMRDTLRGSDITLAE